MVGRKAARLLANSEHPLLETHPSVKILGLFLNEGFTVRFWGPDLVKTSIK